MVSVVERDEWRAGALGEHVDTLLCRDINPRTTLHTAITILLENGRRDLAVDAAALALTVRSAQDAELETLIRLFPVLLKDHRFENIAVAVRNQWWYSKYERGPTLV